MACTAAQRDFHFSPLVALPLGLSFGFGPHLCVCTTLRHLFLTQVRGRESSGLLGHTYSLRQGRGVLATTEVCANCLQRQRLTESCNRLGCACSGGCPSLYLRRQGTVCGGSGIYTPCMTLNNGSSFPRQTTLPLRAFPATETLTHPLCCILKPTAFLSPDLLSHPML